MPTYTVENQLEDFYNRFDSKPSCAAPNWMQLEFKRLLPAKYGAIVVIDHKDPEARKALGALISRMWLVNEDWEIITTRPNI